MILPGLVSVTFRKLGPTAIVRLVEKAGLSGIEWGGDVHVPHGDEQRARDVAAISADAGIKVAAYGSYYRVGAAASNPVPFGDVLGTAVALGAPVIRVWGGNQGSDHASDAYWQEVVDESRRMGDEAAKAGITAVFEFHGNTLSDSDASARKLVEAINHEHVKLYWQVIVDDPPEKNLEGLNTVLPWVVNAHAFHWQGDGKHKRLPLAKAKKDWQRYLAALAGTGRDHWALLEFVRDDDPEAFLEDAETLKSMIAGLDD